MARGGTLIKQVMGEIQGRIAARTALPGSRLPSVRVQAKTLDVSVSTVVEAYERLAAEGVLVSRPGSGFYVAGQVAPVALTEMGPKLDREVDPLWVSRQSLAADADSLRPGCGWLPVSWMYEDGLRRGGGGGGGGRRPPQRGGGGGGGGAGRAGGGGGGGGGGG
ncbi:GntR family transcriptional regulator, partial [Achromobacter aegrifaciens]|uniref:GntR family transcriptional regulator n=1 Tax=Achromobacter aegrifaciens TaxID=1287736 RepID=UPI001FCC4EC0